MSAINKLDCRTAMGLKTQQFVATRSAQLSRPNLNWGSIDSLIQTISDREQSVECRVAAGQVLTILGDPRINCFQPEMIAIEAADVRTGLSREKLGEVFAKYSDVGVERAWIEKECPEHLVQLDRYAIGRYPVTNQEYLEFLKSEPDREIPSTWKFGIYPEEKGNHPVCSLSADAADQYGLWLGQRTGRKFRLPTEAEWEYAAAGPLRHEFPWGENWEPDRSNTAESGFFKTTPIGAFPGGRSWCGAEDMAGNVEEYVSDDYHPYPNGLSIHDDLALALGTYRVARGGSFARFRDLARCKRRHGAYPSELYVMGFRLAEDI